MSPSNVNVISTGLRSPNAALCKRSVACQQGVNFCHIYVEAGDQRPRRTKMENLVEQIAELPADRVVALVDGDDFLAHDRALARALEEHAAGAWVTYGSFMTPDGQRGFAAPYASSSYRTEPWLATHLKTFRAGLFQRIKPEDLTFEGKPIDRGDDPAFMLPILEMAGPGRVRFIPEILYVYDAPRAWEQSASGAELAHQAEIVRHVRSLPPYAALEVLE